MNVQFLYDDDNHTVGVIGNTSIQVWRGKETLLGFEREIVPINNYFSKHYKKGYLSLMLIEQTSGIPTQERMQEAAKVWRMYDEPLKGFALIVIGEGFRAATVRGAATTVNLLAAPKSAMHIFSQVAPAAAWLEECSKNLDVQIASQSLIQALEQARNRAKPLLVDPRLPQSLLASKVQAG